MTSYRKAIDKLKDLLTLYQNGEGNYLKQSSKTSMSWSDYEGDSFPKEITREQLLKDAENPNVDLSGLFVRIMAWGFGPVGYARYRTSRILNEVNSVDGRTISSWMEGIRTAALESPVNGFNFLDTKSGQIKYLGLAFATKSLYFLSPKENRAPILDSVVISWLWRYEIATNKQSINLEFKNFEGYKIYIDFVDMALGDLSELLDQKNDVVDRGFIEYLIFQDQLAYRSDLSLEKWLRRTDLKIP